MNIHIHITSINIDCEQVVINKLQNHDVLKHIKEKSISHFNQVFMTSQLFL